MILINYLTTLIKRYYWVALILLILMIGFFTVGQAPVAPQITWGVNFSQKHASNFNDNWRESYEQIIKDLGVKHIKLATYWDLIEPDRDEYQLDDLDWQIELARDYEVNLLVAIGMKTPRWPECHLPDWAKSLSKKEQQDQILQLIKELVTRYRDSPALKYWQVENEPFFPYGDCPWVDTQFLAKEIDLVKSLDTRHPVIITDSGEGSLWFKAASKGDLVGTTLYKKVWSRQIRSYFYYPLPEVFYYRKASLIRRFFNKRVICVELQAEPWGPSLIYDLSLEEQSKTMNPQQFKNIIRYAQHTGLDEFYFWGAEWWYWLKEEHQQEEIWNTAQTLF